MKNLIGCIFLILIPLPSFCQTTLNADIKPITENTLRALCDDELKWLRNEIYARHGYVFNNKEIQSHFEQDYWYKPVTDNNLVKLSSVEQNNVTILRDEENKRESRSKAIKAYFKNIKADISRKPQNSNTVNENDVLLSEILSKIDIDQMNFCGVKGLYKITIDNGFSETCYFLEVDQDRIRLGYNSQGVSSIFPNEERRIIDDDDFVEQQRVNEYLQFWEYEIDNNNRISFVKIDGAG